MEADFDDQPTDAACRCCEYRQFIRGVFIVNGVSKRHLLPDPAGGPPQTLSPTAWLEDGFTVPPAHVNQRYGHRDETTPGNADASDRYLPDRSNGCAYRGSDFPGLTARPGYRYEIQLEFQGRIIDVCNDVVTATWTWTVALSGVI